MKRRTPHRNVILKRSLLLVVMLVGACRAPLPALTPYGTTDSVAWSRGEDREPDDTLSLLANHPDPKVRAGADRTRKQMRALEEERDRRLLKLRETEQDRADLLSDVLMIHVDTTALPDAEPSTIRKEMIEQALAEEAAGRIGSALQFATIAGAIEKYDEDLDLEGYERGLPRRMERRLIRRLDLIRLGAPEIALALVDRSDDEEENRSFLDARDLSKSSLANASAVIELIEDHHADRPESDAMIASGLEEVKAVLLVLEKNGHEEAAVMRTVFENRSDELRQWGLGSLLTEIDLIQDQHAGDSLPRRYLLRVFTEGATGAVDRRTSVIWPDEFERYLRQIGRRYRGIGSSVTRRASGEIELVPTPGGPAARAGVRSGDVVLEVDGLSSDGLTLDDLTMIATDPDRYSVDLLLERADSGERETVTVTLGPVYRPNVSGWSQKGVQPEGGPTWNWLADVTDRIGYVRLDGFRPNGDRAIRLALKEAQQQSLEAGGRLEGLVLDLRSNGGGQVGIAEEVANLFLDEGSIFRSTDGRKQMEDDRAKASHAELAGIPLVILVDEQSASASELVSGLLQARAGALVIGERTFGKGSIQTPMRAFSNDCMVLVTTGWYLLPERGADPEAPWRFVDQDRNLEEWGVLPDVLVPMSFDETAAALEHRGRWYSGVEQDRIPVGEDSIVVPPDPVLELGLTLLKARVADARDREISDLPDQDPR